MARLVLSLAPNERYMVNGALLQNGDRTSRIRILDNNARVLRWSDALKPDEVNTPVKQVYYAIQLLITGDLCDRDVIPALLSECNTLEDVFSPIDPALLPTLRSMIERGNFYSALCHLRKIAKLESELLRPTADTAHHAQEAKVA